MLTDQNVLDMTFDKFTTPGAEFGYDVETADAAYLTSTGRTCAIGALLPRSVLERMKRDGVDRYTIDQLLGHGPDGDAYGPVYDVLGHLRIGLLKALQEAHDDIAIGYGQVSGRGMAEDMHAQLVSIAAMYDLEAK